MVIQADLQYLNGVDVYGIDGGKIGSAGQVYLDDRTGEPEWIGVRTGVFGTTESFVPLDEATLTDDRLEVPFDRDRVRGAPRIHAGGDLNPADEDELDTYYGLGPGRGHLRKYLVTEQPSRTAPITGGNAVGEEQGTSPG
jgi:hypothetical protein